jgi:hypothetical protein
MPPDWIAVFNGLYAQKMTSDLTFRKAVLSGGKATYPAERTLPVGIRYIRAGFDFRTGVMYAEDRIEAILWLRDWFERTTDGATAAELTQMVADLRGDVVESSREHWSQFLLDGNTLKYDRHALDRRPDGVPFAIILMFQAAA